MSANPPSLSYTVSEDLGRKAGPNSEFTLFFKVKAGHETQIREDLAKFEKEVKTGKVPFLVGLHDGRACLFDEDTRLLFATNFDGSMNAYADDAFTRLLPLMHVWLRQLEGYPGTMDAPPTDLNKAKEWFMSHFRKSSLYTRMYPRTLQEIQKGLRVNDAFQKVLDDPAARKALQDPALKPLLDEASD